MTHEYKEFLVFTRLTPWQDWTMAAQADTIESAILAAKTHRDYYLDEEADVLVARYQDIDISPLYVSPLLQEE